MQHRICLMALWLSVLTPLSAQRTGYKDNGITMHSHTQTGMDFEFHADGFAIHRQDSLLWLTAEACNATSHETGKPCLPQHSQLVVIPPGAEAEISIGETVWEYNFLDNGSAIAPCPAARPKRTVPVAPVRDEDCYRQDTLYALPLVQLTPVGTMRGLRLARLTISPFAYNPVRGQVGICRHFNAHIQFRDGDTAPVKSNHRIGAMLPSALAPTGSKDYNNVLSDNGLPIKYLIVSPTRFQEILRPLEAWKRQEGYLVETLYVDVADRDSIRNALKSLYDHATPMNPAPLFILIVGDFQDIPAWNGSQHVSGLESHFTDLPYAEYTGDHLPDALLGRLPASDTATLRHIIDKTLAYEQFRLSDSNYLHRSLLVAGKELRDPAPTVTNGQINYLKEYLMQTDTAHDTACYYNPSSDSLGAEIYSHLQQGVGLVTYTAHCTASGWRNPNLNMGDIDTLDESGMPFLSINNCCRSNAIVGDCFGEHLLRKADGGAIGVVGASNETLWDEDYWWCVGNQETLTPRPDYQANGNGAYDRLFHTHQEPFACQAPTQSQIVVAGNWAVSRSGSPYDKFYWEIYSLLGDPSLMPYIGVPAPQRLTVGPLHRGDAVFELNGVAHARVAATYADTLLGVCTLDADGHGVLATQRPILDSVTITATAQFHRPLQTTIVPIPNSGSRPVVEAVQLWNTSGQLVEQFTLRDSTRMVIRVRNVGNDATARCQLKIQGLSDNQFVYEAGIGHLNPDSDTTISLWICPEKHEPDGTLTLLFTTTESDSSHWSNTWRFDLLEPQVALESALMLHNGQPVESVKPGSDYQLRITTHNNGTGKAKDLSIKLLNSQETYFLGDLPVGGRESVAFNLTTDNSRDTLALTVKISHRADTVDHCLLYPADSTVAIARPETGEEELRIFPNPTHRQCTMAGFNGPTSVYLYDSMGRLVDTFTVQKEHSIQYNTSKLRCGVYSVLFVDSSRRAVRKLTVR